MSTKDGNITTAQHDAKLPVISRYFSCRFFKGQVLHSYILQATDEDDVRKKFKQKYRGRYNLLEISQL